MKMQKTLLGIVTCIFVIASGASHAGAYIFAGESNGINVVTHPKGYNGTGGNVEVKVCIVPGTPNAAAMVVPLSNSVDRFNLLVPTIGNLRQFSDNDIASNAYDFESVLTHELGHCQGLAHVNLATESGLSGSNQNYTKTTDGADNAYGLNDGADNVIGSSDDIRGDDVNLHWFFVNGNNPFVYPSTPESGTYSRDVADLPSGHNFVTNADRAVSTSIFGLSSTESVMQQGTFNDEDQRALAADDVVTLHHARVGLDRIAGTADDYTVTFVDGGISDSGCDINISFDNTETGFAVCKTSGTFLTGGDVAITAANSYYNTSAVTWHFGTRLIPLPAADNITVASGGSVSALDGGGSSLLTNDTDQEGDGLLLSSDTYFGPEAGNVTLNADGTFTYTHDGVSSGDDRFVYRVCADDGAGAESNACAHQYVHVTVTGTGSNNAPTAADDAIATSRGATVTSLVGGATSLLANDSDPDTDNLSLTTTPTSGPSNGSITLLANGTFSYTHDNSVTSSDSFEYQVCDDGTPTACSTATVNITVDVGDVVCATPDVTIPDGNAGGVSNTLNVVGGETLSDLDVAIEVTQAYVGDISVTLTHVATGTQVDLLDRPGVPASTYGCSNANIDVVLDDEAGSPAEDQCSGSSPAIGGTLTPSGTLSDFDGETFSGDWTLVVSDAVTPDQGTLNSWCLIPTTNGNAPIAANDGPGGAFVVDEGAGVTLSAAQIKANDNDAEDGTPPDGDVALAGSTVNGGVVDNGNQTFTFTHNGGETVAASFQYQVADADGNISNTATVNLTVNAQNDPPAAANDGPGGLFVVSEGQDVTLSAASVTANDSDAEDGTPGGSVSLAGIASNGVVQDNGNQTFTFTHDGSETAAATFQYQVADADGATSNTATVSLTVNAANDAPIASDDGPGGAFVVDEGQSVTFNAASLKSNDSDAEDGTPGGSITLSGGTSNGSVQDNGDQTFTFTHDGSETASATFQYRVADSDGQTSNTATVTLSVTPQKDSPVANDDGPGGVFVVNEDQSVTLTASDLTANDTDEEDTTPTGMVSIAGSAANGTVVDNANQTFTFTHDGSETDAATFQYQVLDSDGLSSNVATVRLTVNPQNDSPEAMADGPGGAFVVDENNSVTLSAAQLRANDTDAEDGTPSGAVTVAGSSVNGAVIDNGNQTFTFTHDGTQSVSASFQYQVADSNGAASNVAAVNLTVNLSNDSPVATDDGPGGAFSVDEGLSVTLSATQLSANDADSEDGVPGGDVALAGSTVNGGVVDNGNQTFTFTHDGGESATASFQYQIADSLGLVSNVATVSLAVTAANDAPVANDDGPGGVFVVNEGSAVSLSAAQLIANDSDAEDGIPGGEVAVAGVTVDGTVQDNGDQTFTFTHDGSQNGTASFQYEVTDANGSVSNIATVTLTVNAIGGGNTAPVAVADSISTTVGGTAAQLDGGALSLLDNDSDAEFDDLAVSLTPISGPSYGDLTLQLDGTFNYIHDGSLVEADSFVYEVCDDGTPALCSTATVAITVDLGTIVCAIPGVAIPDGDANGVSDTLTVASGQTVSDLDVALEITHTYVGDLSATLTHVDSGTVVSLLDRPGRTDSGFGCANADVDVLLDDEAGEAAEDECAAAPAISGTFYPSGNLSDFDGNDFTGDWTITVSDAVSADTGTLVSWCLIPTFNGNAPIALNDGPGGIYSVDEGGNVTISAGQLTANDTDAEDGVPSGLVSLEGSTTNGGVADNGNQTFTFAHDGSETTSASFQYRVTDADGFVSNTATVTLDVGALNDSPVAQEDGPGGAFTVEQGLSATFSAGLLAGNDTDAEDGIPLGLVTLAGSTENGSVADNGDQTFTFTHDGSETDSARFQYRVADSDGATSGVANVRLTVTPPSSGPTATDDAAVTPNATAVLIDVVGNDIAGEDPVDESTVVIVSPPANGDADVDSLGRVTYSPHAGFSGVDELSYTVLDTANRTSNSATVFVHIGNLAPVPPCGPGGRRVRSFEAVSIATNTAFSGNPSTFTATGLPASLTINASSGVITGMPTPGEAESSPYVVVVSADAGAEQFSFVLTVDDEAEVLQYDSYERSCSALR